MEYLKVFCINIATSLNIAAEIIDLAMIAFFSLCLRDRLVNAGLFFL